MRINKLTLQHITSQKTVSFRDVNIFFSEGNTTGKTTLMRSVLYSFGFPIPSTELVKFDKFKFSLEIIRGNTLYTIERKGRLLTINGNEYDLPIEQASAHTMLFGTDNPDILSNILGAIYFDQEKGWTGLNRFTTISKNRFNVESFFRGLKDDEDDVSRQLVARATMLDEKIKKYKMMLNIFEYQESLTHKNSTSEYKTHKQASNEELLVKNSQLKRVEDEIVMMTEVMRRNKNFSDYISSKKLFVKNPAGGSPILVTKETLIGCTETDKLNEIRKDKLVADRHRLKKEIAELEAKVRKEDNIFGLPNLEDEIERRFSSVQGLNSIQIKAMLEKFQKEEEDLRKKIMEKAKKDNDWVAKAHRIIQRYFEELGVPSKYKVDVFTRELKTKSGAVLHEMVFAYKMAYIQLLSEKLGYALPIFCDSPSGREVEVKKIDLMLGIIKRDFSRHQLIMASIKKYQQIFSDANVISMDGTLFDTELNLFDLKYYAVK